MSKPPYFNAADNKLVAINTLCIGPAISLFVWFLMGIPPWVYMNYCISLLSMGVGGLLTQLALLTNVFHARNRHRE